jgi:hypothetical protein
MTTPAPEPFDPFGLASPDPLAAKRRVAKEHAQARSSAGEETAVRRLLKASGAVGAERALQLVHERETGKRGLTFSTLFRASGDLPFWLSYRRVLSLDQIGLGDMLKPQALEKARWMEALLATCEEAPSGWPAGVVFGPLVGVPGNLLIAHTNPSWRCSDGVFAYTRNAYPHAVLLQSYSSFLVQLMRVWRPPQSFFS